MGWIRVNRQMRVVQVRAQARRINHHARVERYGTGTVHRQRVDIHLLQPGQGTYHVRHPHQHVNDGFPVRRRNVAVGGEQTRDAGAVDQIFSQQAVQWRQANGVVAQ